jgi:hypothetical protein
MRRPGLKPRLFRLVALSNGVPRPGAMRYDTHLNTWNGTGFLWPLPPAPSCVPCSAVVQIFLSRVWVFLYKCNFEFIANKI